MNKFILYRHALKFSSLHTLIFDRTEKRQAVVVVNDEMHQLNFSFCKHFKCKTFILIFNDGEFHVTCSILVAVYFLQSYMKLMIIRFLIWRMQIYWREPE